MILLDRDRQMVLSVGRFGQLAASHVRALHFEGASDTPTYRTLVRLVERKLLARLERRMIGGTGAGSGQYVYQLGSAGWRYVGREGRYSSRQAISDHTLAIADTYVSLLEYERRGRIRIDGFETEPDSHRKVGHVIVRPDLFVDVADIAKRRNISFWVEVDRGTENRTKINEKLAGYMEALHAANSYVPYVLLIAPDDRRAKELRWMVERYPEIEEDMFLVSTASDFACLIFG